VTGVVTSLRKASMSLKMSVVHVGAAGGSLGGYTHRGGITEPARLQAFCRSPAADALCKPPPADSDMRQKRLARLSFDHDFRQRYSEADNSYRHERGRRKV
jgi:hypothetical protein